MVVLLGLLAPSLAWAAPVRLDATTPHIDLADAVDVLEDPSATLSYADVRSPERSTRFAPHRGPGDVNHGFTTSAIWIRFALENPTDAPLERWLEIDQTLLEHAELYVDDDRVRVAGLLHARSERELVTRAYGFRLVSPPRSSRTVHLRFVSQYELRLPLALWELGAMGASHARHGWVVGALFGVMLALALYNAFLFLFVGDRVHLYYAAQVLAMLYYLAALHGSVSLLVPGSLQVGSGAGMLALATAMACSLLFVERFLDVRATYPRIARLMAAVTGVLVAGLLAGAGGLLSVRQVNLIFPPLATLTVLGWVAVAVLRRRDGHLPARYLIASWGIFGLLGGVAVLAAKGVVQLKGANYLPPLTGAGEAIVLALALADAARRRNDAVSRLHEASKRFVPFEFLALLGKRELPEVQQGDEVEKRMTVFFLDVRSFTTIVEGMRPRETMAFVNGFFARMGVAIEQHGGFIDKFMGDGMMALFEREDAAVDAAIGCLRALSIYNAARATRGEGAIGVGIGLHTGPLMLGTVGGGNRLSCTVLGDSVNLASRIEGMTKAFGASILMTGETRAALPETVETRRLGRVAAKGKRVPVELYEVLDGLTPDERLRKLATRDAIEDGVTRWEAGDFAGARACFEASPADPVASLYLGLLEGAREPAPEGWDGAVRLDAK